MTNPATPVPSLSVDEALESLLAGVEPLEPEPVALEDAFGLVLGEAVSAAERHPDDDTSAMDGYAVRSQDLAGASEARPVTLTLVEDIAAGSPPTRAVREGETSRISTGGLLPVGADAVVMREVVEVAGGAKIRFRHAAPGGQNVRVAGEHLLAGEEVLSSGTRLGTAETGMAAYLGRRELLCHPRVKVAVLATGSELVESGSPLERGQIRDSNGIALAAAVRELGGEVVMRSRVADRREALDEALAEAFARGHVVLTSGGISAGWHDLVRERIEHRGGHFSFHKLRMRPGKPLAFGRCGGGHFFCLPGNPVSTLVTFEIFVKPALLRLMGRPAAATERWARLVERVEKNEAFTIFYRGVLEDGEVRLTGPQGSHMLKSLVQCNVLVRADEGTSVLEHGSLVRVLPYGLAP